MKKVLSLLFVLLIFLIVCAGCSPAKEADPIVRTAKVRYFDGSMDTLEIERFDVSTSGLIHLYLKDGAEMYLGANNIIIIKETEEQYNH